MKSVLRILYGGIFILSYFSSAFSQGEPFKYGKVNITELQTNSCSIDSSAAAFYLYKYGHFDPVQGVFTMQYRIKILKKEGYYRANISVPASVYSHIRGVTFNLENGNIVESKLKSESIFKEKIYGNYYQYNLSMPNVKEGSVVDIEFIYPGFPLEWRFQEEIPVNWSELILPDNARMNFTKTFFGFTSLAISNDPRWVAKNMPAFKPEPYMNSINNYITRMEVDYEVSKWDDVIKILLDVDDYGQLLGPCMFLTPIARSIQTRFKDPEERLKAAFDTMKIMKWNEKFRLLAENSSLAESFKNKSGNAADINLMLVQLLKKLDIDAEPVVMSSRQHGILQLNRPTPLKLDYTIVRARIKEKSYLLDATEEYAPYFILPTRALNGIGKLVNFNSAETIETITEKKDKTFSIYDLRLSENLKLEGKYSVINHDYAALDFRNSYRKFNSKEEFLDDFQTGKPGLVITNSELKNVENLYMPAEIQLDVQLKNQVVNAGDQFYIYPMFYEQLKENIFKMETRNYPIDYAYKREENVVVTIHLPENFEVVELPKPVSMKMPENAAGFYYKITASNNIIQVNYKMSINKTLFIMDEYPFLKEMYHQIVSKHAEPIILKKKG